MSPGDVVIFRSCGVEYRARVVIAADMLLVEFLDAPPQGCCKQEWVLRAHCRRLE